MFARRTNWNLTTNAYTRAIEENRHAGRELLDLTASNPTTIGLHYDQDKLLAALANPQSLIYDPSAKGLLSAREAIAGYYAGSGIHLSPDDLVLTTSTSEGYSFLFRLLCEPGDAILVPAHVRPRLEDRFTILVPVSGNADARPLPRSGVIPIPDLATD